jgi:hypothetical protein
MTGVILFVRGGGNAHMRRLFSSSERIPLMAIAALI